MQQQYKLNRLKTTFSIGQTVDSFWEDLRLAKQRGEKVAWCSGLLATFPRVLGMRAHFMPGYSAYVSGRRAADELIEIAESDGEQMDTCSYHRLHMGMVAALLKGIPVREEVILPLPDVITNARFCPEQSHYGEALSRRLGIPVINIDCPPIHLESDIPMLEVFVERQIRETVIPALEEICGKPFDYDLMSQYMADMKESLLIRNECWEFFKHKPSPWTLWDCITGQGPAASGTEGGESGPVVYFRRLKAELEERVAQGIGAILPEEKYRLYWDGWIPWGFIGLYARKLVSYGAVPLAGRYAWEINPHPELIEPEPDPVHSFVQQLYSGGAACRYSMPNQGRHEISKFIEDYSLDGMVMFASKTCRVWNLGQLDIIDEMERKHGIPGIILDGDVADRRMISEAQIDTRLAALFEMIDARKKARWV